MTGSSGRDMEVFTEAVNLPIEERFAFLDQACGEDKDLRHKIEAWLKSHDRAGAFLEKLPKVVGEGRAKVVAGEKPGDRVDRYKLLQQIGEGGCGIVFMAEQEEPVRRRVALKVIKPGMDTKSVIARFEAERQALALMDHPNIARVLDAGTTESGRPYFVMELVRGTKITDYCEQKSLTTRERLQLFVKVCEAVQHAHQKGIIHRDIKPSNILVMTESDGTAQPKVIDFGIAKATTNQRLTDKTLFTAFEMLIGTPAYMSPEQALLTSVDVDTRTDIYSLGVLLYELLTGTTPFDSKELLKSGLDEIRRVITSQEPVRPSTRLKTLATGDLTVLSNHQRADLPKLIKDIRGDLDWVVMKALEKDRARRYATAHGLALDVLHYLAAEPVSARSPSRLYKFQKLVLRNKLLFTGVGVIALVLVVGLVVVSMALAKERQARQDASAASAKSQQVTKFLEDMLNAAGPAAARGRDATMLREILDQTVARIGKELSNQPAVEAELRDLIGKLYGQMGLGGKAEEMERKALAIRQKQFGPESPEAAASLNDLGLELMAQHKLPEAEKVHREALTIRRRLLGENNADTATSINDLGAVYRDQGKLTEAEALAQEGLRIRRKLSETNNLDVADSLRNLAIIRGSQSRWDEAERIARDVLAIRRELLGPDHIWIASALEDVAWAASGRGKYEEALKLDGEALAMRHNLLGESHPDMARNLNALGQLLKNRGELPAADAVLKAALSIQRKLVGDDQQATLETFYALAQVLDAEGKTAEAESLWREALAVWTRRGEDANPGRLYTLRGLGDTLEHEGRWSEAEAVWRESLALWRKRGGNEEQQSMYTLRKLALALEAERKWPEAESMHREALSISRKKGDEDPEALADLERLVRVLTTEKKFDKAEQLLNHALAPAFLMQTSSANLLVQRVNIMGRRGRWREAVADATLALENQPTDHYRYHILSALLAITHDRPAYEQLSKTLLAKFANPTNPYVAERMVQDCLLLPDSGVDLDLVDKLADIAVTAGKAESSMPYFQACKAMSNHRMGNFRLAGEWAEKALINPTAEAQAKAKAFAILAMATWHLGQTRAARTALANGEALAPNLSPDVAQDLGESWVAWLMARISLDEARTLIDPTMPAGNNSAAEAK